MNIFRRIGDIISSNVNSALDKMENPEKMIDLSITELENSIDEMRVLLAEKRGEISSLEKSIKDSEEALKRWDERASLAVEKGLDDMAREAIKEKKNVEKRLENARSSKEELANLTLKLEENLSLAKEKLTELNETSATLKARAKVAKERIRASKKTNVDESSSYSRRLEELKVKIERWEREADIRTSEVKIRSEKEKASPSFEELERDSEIERELEALKNRIKGETN